MGQIKVLLCVLSIKNSAISNRRTMYEYPTIRAAVTAIKITPINKAGGAKIRMYTIGIVKICQKQVNDSRAWEIEAYSKDNS